MGRLDPKRVVILIICLLGAGLVTYSTASKGGATKPGRLHDALLDIDGWSYRGSTSFDEGTVAALALDDYVNNEYSRGARSVSLYIGYYTTAHKVGAAHDPLVCFPGQGWLLSDAFKGTLGLNSATRVRYSRMVAHRGSERYLLVHWFQSYDETSSDTFRQKIRSLWKKVLEKKHDNAFVRIMTRIDGEAQEASQETIGEFIHAFYPVFLKYIKAT